MGESYINNGRRLHPTRLTLHEKYNSLDYEN